MGFMRPDIGDRAAAKVLLERVADAHHRLELVWADGHRYAVARRGSFTSPSP
ncbi:hypothetical protein [Streptomyces sp. NPDC001851]|uniref:hypothetical protein n=1 Tax=Streptomyces sp. NPDC001851 TaxID=3154529 RepID=UPI0033192840